MRIYATEQLGPKQSMTPEGYLLCEAVPIARTGSQIYAGFELPFLKDGLDGLITVRREEAEVFRPETIASFEGKSVTIGHSFVDPDNWQEVTVGTSQNVRRGDGEQRDLLLADLLITTADAIAEVKTPVDADGRPTGEKALREVSCGYDADYVQDGIGAAFQCNIIGNHVALVPRGRAGPRCSIQDGEIPMTTPKKPDNLLAKLLRAIRTGDAALIKRTSDEAEAEAKKVEDEEAEADKKDTADEVADLRKTVDALSQAVAILAKTKDAETDPDDKDGKTADELEAEEKKRAEDELEAEEKKRAEDEANAEADKSKTCDAMRDTASRAEILVPGFVMPTTDSVADTAGVTLVRRKVLSASIKTADGKDIVTPLLGGRTVDSLTADAVATVFLAASEMMRQKNNARGARSGVQTKDFGGAPASIADMNKRNAEFWANNKA